MSAARGALPVHWPWWTPADAAELDCLLLELARSYFEHRERCEICRARTGDRFTVGQCGALREAILAVLGWREMRELLSRAEWLRAERDRLERESERRALEVA